MKMLVCYDGSENAQSMLEKSLAMFGREKPQVILVAVVEEPVDASSYDESHFDGLCANKEAELKDTAEWVVKQGFDVDVLLAVGDPRKMLVESVRKKNPDMVVITSRPPKGGVRFGNITGSVSDYVIHHVTDRPILIMH
ncbi:MAG: universal stress protein [Nitrosomonadales bacterium]|nr:universal stress protein [Nitrosomonadales bacterium]